MILFSEFKYGPSVTITIPTNRIFALYDGGVQGLIITKETMTYSSNIFDSGSEIREESPLSYSIVLS